MDTLPCFLAHSFYGYIVLYRAFPGGSVVKNPPDNAGDVGLIPGLERSPGEGNGNPLQYSCLGNPMDRGAWRATVHGAARVRHDLATKQQYSIECLHCCQTALLVTLGFSALSILEVLASTSSHTLVFLKSVV